MALKYEAPWFDHPPGLVVVEYARLPSRYQPMLMPTGLTPAETFTSPCHWAEAPAWTVVPPYPQSGQIPDVAQYRVADEVVVDVVVVAPPAIR